MTKLKNNPKVTVVTVSFNIIKSGYKDFFRQCIESVHNQTYSNIEHLIIDGSSTDGTLKIIKEYASKGWIKYISEPDTGIYDAMNKAIKIATGEYIAFLNSDDYWHDKNAVSAAVKVFQDTNCDFCGGNAEFVNRDNPEKNYTKYANLGQVFNMMPFCHQAMFCKTKVIKKEGMFDTSLKLAGDYDFIIRLYLNKYKGAVIPLTFATFRMGGESFKNYETNWDECKAIARKYFSKYYKMTEEELNTWIKELKLPKKLDKKIKIFTKNNNAKNNPKLTIITVCFNLIKSKRIESFKKCIESVHNQTYSNIEHLIIDGSSTDGTLKIIKEYASKGWIKYISEPDKGIYDAMDKGIKIATGDYLYFLNSDDSLHDKKVVRDVIDFFGKNPGMYAIFGNLLPYTLDRNQSYVKVFKLHKVHKFNDIQHSNDLLLKRNIHHQVIFYNKAVLSHSSFFDDQVPNGSDWKLHCQAFIENNFPLTYFDRDIVNFNMGGVSTDTKNNPIEETQKLHELLFNKYGQHLEELDKNKIIQSEKILFFGKTIVRIKNNYSKKKIYLFNFIPLLKIKYKKHGKSCYLFGFFPLYEYRANTLNTYIHAITQYQLQINQYKSEIHRYRIEIEEHKNRLEKFKSNNKRTGK